RVRNLRSHGAVDPRARPGAALPLRAPPGTHGGGGAHPPCGSADRSRQRDLRRSVERNGARLRPLRGRLPPRRATREPPRVDRMGGMAPALAHRPRVSCRRALPPLPVPYPHLSDAVGRPRPLPAVGTDAALTL